jgi:hypothetical protein
MSGYTDNRLKGPAGTLSLTLISPGLPRSKNSGEIHFHH